MALSAEAVEQLGNNSDDKKYLPIIKANNLFNLRKTSNKFLNTIRAWAGMRWGTYTKKGKTLCHAPCFCPVRPHPPTVISRICQLPIERFPHLPTPCLLHSHSSCNALSLLLSPSLSLPLASLPALYSLLAIKHWAAINKLANHFQPSPKPLHAAIETAKDYCCLLLFSLFSLLALASLPLLPFSLWSMGVEWCLCL